MPPPTTEHWIKAAKAFEELWNFPNCLGAIDGKHISIQYPPNAGSEYYNYKGFHSIVLQAVVDANAKFIASKKIDPQINDEFPFVFVGDEAYHLQTNLMRPFPRRNLTNEKRIFNYRLSRARRIVECAFGILVKRFNVLENKMLVFPEKATIITKACCILHNIIMDKEGAPSEIQDELQLQTTQKVVQSQITSRPINRASTAAMDIREKFMNYFNSDIGAVPWQNMYNL
ncbi:putative nuclease HARBI1 [Acyrthosiphon pisum]|uniref:DDE Tnp4 domain-containing protein n=1 Tax=Acyrthosiphon pisum TaxID=7029 RepID=A0A8R2NJ65_ACYPI|nr:putative nuclease HARBI1 [Acyrthosiphon pisum]